MSAITPEVKPNFDDEFLDKIREWREKNKIRDDDAIYLLVEMFRIHQNHWDELRQRQMPQLDQFCSDLTAVNESVKSFRERVDGLIEALATHPTVEPVKTIPLSEAKYATSSALLGGLFFGFLLAKLLL